MASPLMRITTRGTGPLSDTTNTGFNSRRSNLYFVTLQSNGKGTNTAYGKI